MATRIGYPNEHLAVGVVDEMASPMYATGIGLVIEGISRFDFEKDKEDKTHKEDNSTKPKGKKKQAKKGEPGETGPSKFLKSLRDWFESDTTE